MTAFLFGFITCYLAAAYIVYLERKEYFARNAEVLGEVSEWELIRMGLMWPCTIGGK
jgi:hypothetical protein